MESAPNGAYNPKADEEMAKQAKRAKLKEANTCTHDSESTKMDSSLKRHTALIKRMRQSMAADYHDQIMKDIETLTLEKYIDEVAGAVIEGISRCKTEKDVWSAVEIICAVHQRFPSTFTPNLVNLLRGALSAPDKLALAAMSVEQRDKEESSRITRQRPVLRVSAELALVGVIKDAPDRGGGEWIMKILKELLSNDPSLASLPLLSTFLKYFSRPYLGIIPPSGSKQATAEGAKAETVANEEFPAIFNEEEELIEQDIRDRFKRMCEGYFENVCKKLLIEHKRLQEQDHRNHEAYIRSGEIFEDRQQAYEKMTKGYEKLLANCQTLSELLYIPVPPLPTYTQKTDSISIGGGSLSLNGDLSSADEINTTGGKWEDDEERKFYEDIIDLMDYIPRSVLGIDGDKDKEKQDTKEEAEEKEKVRMEQDKNEAKKLEEELAKLEEKVANGDANGEDADAVAEEDGGDAHAMDEEEAEVHTPTPGTPKPQSPSASPRLAPQGPSQLLTALLVRLPDATNKALIDQAATDFALLNSKAARKRLVKFLGQVQKSRLDLLPYYSRLVATLNKYMPDIGVDLVAILDEEFRYQQRKKKVVKEFAELRMRNLTFLSTLTKFQVVPPHLILHMFKVCLDDFSGTNVDNLAILLEGCGRFLLRSADTKERFATMLELMRRKQSLQHFDQRQILLLENAYYQCNPPERGPREEKVRSPMELFIRHLIYDVLAKKTIDKVLKLIRKLDWSSPDIVRYLFKVFTKPWKIKYNNISLLAILVNDLQRYHPGFVISVVDQVLEDLVRGLESNVYSTNQRRVAVMKFLGEMYIYRLLSSAIVFDVFWLMLTFGHPDNRPLPHQHCPKDMPDDFFRIRLICTFLDTCGMCFDRGTQKRKLDNILTFFMYYIRCKNELPMDVDFMVSDSLEAVRPELKLPKTIEEAAMAVDEMFNVAFHDDATAIEGEGEDSGDEGAPDQGERDDDDEDKDDDEDETDPNSPVDPRAPSPDQLVVLSASNSLEGANMGPSEDEDGEFAKELAKMVIDTSTESRKVDKKTALALWDSAVLPPSARRRKVEEVDETESAVKDTNVMTFTVVTKRGNKQQTRQLAVPSTAALAVHTRSAQAEDRVEQQHLKRLVLNYEQREEAEELKALETRNKFAGIKIRYG